MVKSCSISINSSVSARRTRSPLVGPNISAWARREIFIVSLSEGSLSSQLAHDLGVETVDDFVTRQLNQFHRALLPRFKSHRGAGDNVQTEAAGWLAVKMKCRIDLKKMKVGTDLDRPVSRIGCGHGDRFSPSIQF